MNFFASIPRFCSYLLLATAPATLQFAAFAQGQLPIRQDSAKSFLQLCDSINIARTKGASGLLGTTAPGEYPFTSEQDRRFYEALSVPLSPSLRFCIDARQVFADVLSKPDRKRSLIELARETVDVQSMVSAKEMPEIRRYKEDISHSFSIPGVKEFSTLPGLFEPSNINLRGLFQEDLTPMLRYRLEEAAQVNVSIFSDQAALVRRLYQGFQAQGEYTHVWNNRNDEGYKVASGYYVGVITIGTTMSLRKPIRVD